MADGDRRANVRGVETRRRILEAAVDLASVEGVEGLTLGRLAEHLGISKAGLLGHFETKDALVLATIERAGQIFLDAVITPALSAPDGLPRLVALSDAWLAYAASSTFRGGCFFASASAELDGRPGPARDAVAKAMRAWLDLLEGGVREASAHGHLKRVDAAQVAFELQSLELGANWARQLFGDKTSTARAHRAIRERLDGLSTAAGRRALATQREAPGSKPSTPSRKRRPAAPG